MMNKWDPWSSSAGSASEVAAFCFILLAILNKISLVTDLQGLEQAGVLSLCVSVFRSLATPLET